MEESRGKTAMGIYRDVVAIVCACVCVYVNMYIYVNTYTHIFLSKHFHHIESTLLNTEY